MNQPHRKAMMQAAEQAGDIVRRYFAAIRGEIVLELGAELKSEHPHDVVTDADRKAQDVIEQVLLSAFPDYGFYAEENGRDVEVIKHQNGVRRFVVDPIDGTHNFTKGLPDFSISIALQELEAGKWRNIAGLVYLVAHNELFFAEAGLVQRLAAGIEQPLKLSATTVSLQGVRVEDAIYSRVQGEFQAAVEAYRHTLLYAGAYNHKSFSTAQRLAEMAAGRIPALAVGGDFFEWDVAAGLAIAEQAGATLIHRVDHGLPVVLVGGSSALATALEDAWEKALSLS